MFLTRRGAFALTYHQFNRLAVSQMITPCADCTEQMQGEIGYHLNPMLVGKPKRLEQVAFDLLDETLH